MATFTAPWAPMIGTRAKPATTVPTMAPSVLSA